jgi:hypothetical protein
MARIPPAVRTGIGRDEAVPANDRAERSRPRIARITRICLLAERLWMRESQRSSSEEILPESRLQARSAYKQIRVRAKRARAIRGRSVVLKRRERPPFAG